LTQFIEWFYLYPPAPNELRQTATSGDKNAFGVDSADMKLGWFEPMNNTPFDLK
jgi:hypothetical protein